MVGKSEKKQIPQSFVVILMMFIRMVVKRIDSHNTPEVFHMDSLQSQHKTSIDMSYLDSEVSQTKIH